MEMHLKVANGANAFPPSRVLLRCPHCGREGTLDAVNISDLGLTGDIDGKPIPGNQRLAGIRRCPNPKCQGLVFVVMPAGGGQPDLTYPASRTDFDDTNVPANIRECIEEMLECHAQKCYVAAAIMGRRTLELICEDKGAVGHDLKARIQSLGVKIVLPQELLTAMDELRLLGNDAAHVEAKTFSDIDKAHLDVAIDFTKEILKATYQYAALLDKLKALRKPPAP